MDSCGASDIKESANGPYWQGAQSGYSVETRICPAKDGIAVSLHLVDSSKQSKTDQAMAEVRPVGWVSANTWDSRSKTCPVSTSFDLVDFTKEKEAPGYSKTLGRPRTALRAYRSEPPDPDSAAAHSRPTCVRTVRFAEQPCSPCLRRRTGKGTKNQECRYKESYNVARQGMENCQLESFPSERGVRTDPLNFQRPIQKHTETNKLMNKQYPQVQPVNGSLVGDSINTPNDSEGSFAELVDLSEGANTCQTPAVIGTSEKCHIVVQGSHGEGSRNSYEETIPRLHVVCGKKSTTFGLVSPKVNRRMPPKQDDPQDDKRHSPLDNGPWTGTTVSSSEKHNADIEKHGTRTPLFATTKPEICLLQSEMVCLTGGRDRSSRAVVEVYGDHQHWASPLLSSFELSKLLLYFHTISRKAVRELGMTIVYDTRKTPLHPQFTEALQMVQEQDPKAIHTVLLLMSKGKIHSHKKYPGEMEVVTSFKGLYKHIECSQLSPALNGTFPYNYRNWLHMHQELYPFVLALKEATCMLFDALRRLDGICEIDTAQDVQQCVHEQRALMKSVLEDAQLVALQKQGGALLARLRWESDVRSAQTKASREVMDTVECLYNQLEEQVHVLVGRSNVLFKHFALLLQLKEMESRFSKIKEWFDVEGKQQTLEAESVEDPSRIIQEILQCFITVLSEANEHKHQALRLATEAENIQGPDFPETERFHTMVSTLKSNLSDFLTQAEHCCEELKTMLNLSHFCERASTMAVDCLEQLKQERVQHMTPQEKWVALQQCHEKLSEFSPEHFQEAKALAYSLQSALGMQVWNMTWLKCQEVSRQLEDTLQDLEKIQHPSEPVPPPNRCHGDGAPDHTAGLSNKEGPVLRQHGTRNEAKFCRDRDSIHGTVSCFNISFRQSRRGRKESKTALTAEHEQNSRKGSLERKQNIAEGSETVGCQWFPWQHTSTNIKQGTLLDSSTSRTLPSTCNETQTPAPTCSAARVSELTCSGVQTSVPTCSLVRSFSAPQACQHHPYSQSGNVCSESLESEARTTANSRSEETDSWERDGAKVLSSPGSDSNMKLLRIMEEMLLTEFEYVRSLAYVLTHYLPLLAQPDVPPDLRGQRGRIFGNLEKLYQFHCHYFLQELQACRTDPLMVGHCFLRHRENFGLYALYSKNKPHSDALVQQHMFFKRKQMELGDSMDLSSYLLKPVQRISKYSLLLQEMLEECEAAHSQERLELQGAAEVVRFQLRHGNDLLTMDAIKDCDVNLKEQGQLIRQDEFYVTCRKKRALRRVFLFQDLILFTKTKKTHCGDEVYIYKQSLKTCDIGLTQNCGRSGLCFEIWFRRRRAQDTYILQADRQDVKEAWTADLQRILWEQALKNRELWKQELVFMGIGSKPFLNFEPTNDLHGITYHLPEREVDGLLKSQNSVVTSLQSDAVLPRPESIGSGGSVSTSRSQSSSSSGRGSLSPSGFRENQVNESCHGIYVAGTPRSGDEHQKKLCQSGLQAAPLSH